MSDRQEIHDRLYAGTEIHPAPAEFSEDQIFADPILQFFHYAHLPPGLRATSSVFCGVAQWMIHNLPRNAERSAGLRKLLEAKDCAVRANVHKDPRPLDLREAYEAVLNPRAADRPLDLGEFPIVDEPKIVGGDQSEEPIPFR